MSNFIQLQLSYQNIPDSDEHFSRATKAVQDACGCDEFAATQVVRQIACYIARFNDEVINQHGPAHEYCKERGI